MNDRLLQDSGSEPETETETEPMLLAPVRRVVTGHDAAGRSVFISDGPAPHQNAPSTMPDMVARVLWMSDCSPAPLDVDEPAPAELKTPMAPPPSGTILRVADFPPDSRYEQIDIAEMFREIGGADAHAAGQSDGDARHFWFHKTPSLDYAIVLDGEIWALMDDGESLLSPGDILIQRGTNHAWANRSDEPCRVAFVLIDAAGDRD